jgi:hypothetical protein
MMPCHEKLMLFVWAMLGKVECIPYQYTQTQQQ